MKKAYDATSIVGTDGAPIFTWKAKVFREYYFTDEDGDEVYMVIFEREDGELFKAGFKLNPADPIVYDNHWIMILEVMKEQHNIEVLLHHDKWREE